MALPSAGPSAPSEVRHVADTATRGLRSSTRVLLAALVCLQVGVPVWATFEGIPHKFGFHMYTGYEPMSVEVLDAAGLPIPVDLSDWIVVPREDIDWAPRLGPAICASTARAASVVVRQQGTDRAFSC